MQVRQTIFIAISLLALILVRFTFDGFDVVVPGFHKTYYYVPQWYHYFSPFFFFAISVLYRIAGKGKFKIGRGFFITHTITSILATLIINLPLASIRKDSYISVDNIESEFIFRAWIAYLSILVYLVLSFILLFRILKMKNINKLRTT